MIIGNLEIKGLKENPNIRIEKLTNGLLSIYYDNIHKAGIRSSTHSEGTIHLYKNKIVTFGKKFALLAYGDLDIEASDNVRIEIVKTIPESRQVNYFVYDNVELICAPTVYTLNAKIYAYGRTRVDLEERDSTEDTVEISIYENATLYLFSKATVRMYDNSKAEMIDDEYARVEAYDKSEVVAKLSRSVTTKDNSKAIVYGASKGAKYTSIFALNKSHVKVYGPADVNASGDATVEVPEYVDVYAYSGNPTIIKRKPRN